MKLNIRITPLILCIFGSLKILKSYDYYTFALQMPGTICHFQECNDYFLGSLGSKSLNIHGLWPNFYGYSTLEYCNHSVKYDIKKISKKTQKLLDSNWVGLFFDSNRFRKYEWEKHGTCFENKNQFQQNSNLKTSKIDIKMENYFETAIKVKQRIDLERIVFSQKTWITQDLILKMKFGLKVQKFWVNCREKFLIGFYICFDKNLKIIDCSSKYGTNCGEKSYAPELIRRRK